MRVPESWVHKIAYSLLGALDAGNDGHRTVENGKPIQAASGLGTRTEKCNGEARGSGESRKLHCENGSKYENNSENNEGLLSFSNWPPTPNTA